ncbi:hypothetical protein BU24DRAFT_275815 [Aaosphaeria arxii CBS 175.79]|uniref:IgE-binding protein n=1 Tax=Aaosphaeria arxii CBS 175.79 TaxID=1450172 RepID=A0A6A5XHM2_9PLEO|nr:uncharacterized protein BU24DRAFT_275815 [Aaosphaeria arxii CBS 175.79]KAF2012379.1 hypothetical protein BU24DRAFT_275815 [Aaosphaeria arxii CBS 175.79]
MKSVVALSLFAAGALAQAPAYFSVLSTRSASPVHLLPLTARGGKFFLGGPGPSSYCPPQVGDGCPSGNTTVFAGGEETLSLGVVVPGGQQVYVGPDGNLSYTSPHSAYKPEGSIVDGWSKGSTGTFGTLVWENGLVACPAGEGEGYQVFGQIEGVERDPACLGFNAITANATDAGAWQY